MALKHSQFLKLSQKLLPQQIQLMKLLQLPTLALEERIKEELELNPALEEDSDRSDEEELYSNEGADDETREFVVVEGPDFHSQVEQQLGLRDLTEQEYTIGIYIIGCIDE